MLIGFDQSFDIVCGKPCTSYTDCDSGQTCYKAKCDGLGTCRQVIDSPGMN